MNARIGRIVRFASPLFALWMGSAVGAWGQLNSTTASVALTATLSEAVSVSVTPATMSFTLVPGGNAVGAGSLSITTSWILATGRANFVLDAYFTTAASALSTAGPPVVNIPSSEVLGQMTTGTPSTYTAFTQTAALGGASAGLTLYTVPLTTSNRSGGRTDTMTLEINLSGTPQIPAAVYTGTMFLQAQAL